MCGLAQVTQNPSSTEKPVFSKSGPDAKGKSQMESMTVRDAMHTGVVSCDSSVTVHEAAQMMNRQRMRSLVIVDFDCALGGIISESDIVAAKLLNTSGRSWDQITVGDIMTNRVMTVAPEMPLTEAAKIIVEHRIHRAVVAEPDDLCNPIGILSLGDIMRYIERLDVPDAVFASGADTIEVVEASVTILAPSTNAPSVKRPARKSTSKATTKKKPAAKKTSAMRK